MAEDPKLAREASQRDMQRVFDDIKDLQVKGHSTSIVSYDTTGLDRLPADMPRDGDGAFIPFTIGARGNLTKPAARDAAMVWRQMTANYPKAVLYPHLIGYDEDPREIWELPDATRYVRLWARLAGIHSPDDIPHAELVAGTGLLGFLAACGCFGESLKRTTLEQFRHDYGQTTAN
jgi:hypothetical protein